MKHFLLVFLLIVVSSPLYAVFSLRVGDPRISASTQQGTIESAVLSVRPQGLYMEYGLYLTFSARGTTYKPTDSLEVTLRFDLPVGAIVHDSWLWINDDISRALILDRWTASQIYEDIVQRRQDPSILFKTSATQHELRIFPMKGDETRKVKITYLMPADWNRETVEADLPIELLKTSKNPVAAFHILAWADADWKQPTLANQPSTVFQEYQDSTQGTYYSASLATANQQTGLRLSYRSPLLQQGHYVRALSSGQTGFYQLALLPSLLFEHEARRKIVLLVDQQASPTSVAAASLFQELRRQFLRELNAQDSFNIIVSNLSPNAVSGTWLPADSATIAQAFATAETLLATYSNLPSLLATGINFVKAHGNTGSILLATNVTQYGPPTATNPLIADMMALMGTPMFPIHTLNYHNSTAPFYSIGGGNYYGSDYLLINLAKLSGGNFSQLLGYPLATAVASAVQGTGAALRSYDFHTTVANGYCYGRFDLGEVSNVAYLNKPILQIGKYSGDFPFKMELAGELGSQFVSAEIVVDANQIGVSDTLNREIWHGNYIRLLETGTATNSTVSEIIYNSIAERVLSRYTAFLCLEEPAQYCYDCTDESQLVSTTDMTSTDVHVRAWPNPFADRVTIEVRAAAGTDFSSSANVEIYKANGQLVCQLPLTNIRNDTATVVWNGVDSASGIVPPGTYIAIARINRDKSAVLKLVKKG